MGAKAVILHHAAPMAVDHAPPLGARADAVAPVIFIGKAAARPAQVGNVDPAQRVKRVIAQPSRVGDR